MAEGAASSRRPEASCIRWVAGEKASDRRRMTHAPTVCHQRGEVRASACMALFAISSYTSCLLRCESVPSMAVTDAARMFVLKLETLAFKYLPICVVCQKLSFLEQTDH